MAWSQFDKAMGRLEGGVEADDLDDSITGDSDEEAADAGSFKCNLLPLGFRKNLPAAARAKCSLRCSFSRLHLSGTCI